MAANVVVGFDGSSASLQALRHGVQLARDGRVIVVHAREAAPAHIAPEWRDLLDREHIREGTEMLEAVVRDNAAALALVAIETRLEAGPAAPAILAVAHAVDADVIVVGSHGFAPFARLLGSVAYELLRTSDLPVMVIPPACTARMAAEEHVARAS